MSDFEEHDSREQRGRRFRRLTLVLGLMSLIAAACGGGEGADVAEQDTPAEVESPAATGSPESPADDSTGSLETLYAAAQEEGAVVWYQSLAPEAVDLVLDAFQEAYPGVEVQPNSKPSQALLEQFLTEKRAGRNDADLFTYFGASPFLGVLVEEEFVTSYVPQVAESYPDEFIIDDVAYPVGATGLGAAYAPDRVDEEGVELLKSYQGWTDSRWEGRAAMIAPTGGSTGRAQFYWARQDSNLGDEWLSEIAQLSPTVFTSTSPALQRMIAGDFDVVFNMTDAVAGRNKATGAPVHFVYPEYTVVTANYIALASDAPNPNAAKLLMEWALSEDGQLAFQQAGGLFSLHAEQTDPPFDYDWYEQDVEQVAADEARFEAEIEEFTEQWATVMDADLDE